jgi:hypothetical protein
MHLEAVSSEVKNMIDAISVLWSRLAMFVNSIHTASTRVFIPGQHLKKSGRKGAIGRFELDVANQGGKLGWVKSKQRPMRILIPRTSADGRPKDSDTCTVQRCSAHLRIAFVRTHIMALISTEAAERRNLSSKVARRKVV